MNLTDKDITRFWSKVRKSGQDDCWEWQACKNEYHYGLFNLSDHSTLAHRVAFFIAHGFIDDALDTLHTCDNPPCCNPKHLFQGTHFDNMQDCARKGRNSSQTHPENLARGDKHGLRLHPESLQRGNKHWMNRLKRIIPRDSHGHFAKRGNG